MNIVAQELLSGIWGYGLCAAVSLLLALVLLAGQRQREIGSWLIVAAAINMLWGLVMVAFAAGILRQPIVNHWAELLRACGWVVAIVAIGRPIFGVVMVRLVFGALVLLLIMAVLLTLGLKPSSVADTMLYNPVGLMLSLLVLVLLEQLYRNATANERWSLKLLVLVVGGNYVFDFFLYAEGMMLESFRPETWQARGFVDTFLLPLLLVATRRNPEWKLDVFVSRQVTFFTGAILAVGVYALVIATGGYWIAWYGGSWGASLQFALVTIAGVVLFLLLFSSGLRRRAQVFVAKHFYRNKYDYRVEWLRFVSTLSAHAEFGVADTAARAVAQIFTSPGALVYLLDRGGRRMAVAGRWPTDAAQSRLAQELPVGSELLTYLLRSRWVIDVHEYANTPARYDNVTLPKGLLVASHARIIAPLLVGDQLIGIICLREPPPPFELTFEDRDLLKTVCQHVATQLAQHLADQQLAESRQFEAHGRLTAFMMHDLKNAAAQLQLMVKNSERHRNNPEFFADAITTVDNAVERINKLIQQLSGRGSAGPTRAAELGALLHDAVARCGQRQPVPAISDGAVAGLMVNCDPTRLTAIFEHVLRNAQEATPVSGEINVTLTEESGQGRIEVRDSGAGMSADFMRARLFRPFDSTKGAQGMGIGAFQVREYVRELGGDVEVFSSAGQGTRFCIMLPVLQNAARG